MQWKWQTTLTRRYNNEEGSCFSIGYKTFGGSMESAKRHISVSSYMVCVCVSWQSRFHQVVDSLKTEENVLPVRSSRLSD